MNLINRRFFLRLWELLPHFRSFTDLIIFSNKDNILEGGRPPLFGHTYWDDPALLHIGGVLCLGSIF
jgi:hypothetical protein